MENGIEIYFQISYKLLKILYEICKYISIPFSTLGYIGCWKPFSWKSSVRLSSIGNCVSLLIPYRCKGTRGPSQYPKRRLFVRSRKVSKPRDLYLELSDPFEIWQALSNFKPIRQFKVPISWLRDFTRSYEKTSFRILRRDPVSMALDCFSRNIPVSGPHWGRDKMAATLQTTFQMHFP